MIYHGTMRKKNHLQQIQLPQCDAAKNSCLLKGLQSTACLYRSKGDKWLLATVYSHCLQGLNISHPKSPSIGNFRVFGQNHHPPGLLHLFKVSIGRKLVPDSAAVRPRLLQLPWELFGATDLCPNGWICNHIQHVLGIR